LNYLALGGIDIGLFDEFVDRGGLLNGDGAQGQNQTADTRIFNIRNSLEKISAKI